MVVSGMRDMDAAEARGFLSSGVRTAKVATVSPKGKPHVAPVWFIVDGDDLVFITTATSAKGRHLHANPRAAVAVDDDAFPYAFVVASGRVSLDDEAPDRLLWATRIASRYVPERADEFGARNDAPGETLVRLHLERVFGQADLAL
jgi:PPOX class probable F420-dependent enzyme